MQITNVFKRYLTMENVPVNPLRCELKTDELYSLFYSNLNIYF
jgi:hypothetical protein